jgi:hypothetical protein
MWVQASSDVDFCTVYANRSRWRPTKTRAARCSPAIGEQSHRLHRLALSCFFIAFDAILKLCWQLGEVPHRSTARIANHCAAGARLLA